MSNIDKRPLKPGTYAILFRNNWDGEGDVYETLATLSNDLVWYHYENGNALIEYEGDEVLKAWPLDDGSNMLALLDALEAKDKRNERALSLLSYVNTENVWEIIGRLKTVISDDYRSEPEIAAAVKGE